MQKHPDELNDKDSGESSTRVATETEAAVLHLLLAQLDIYRLMILSDVTENAEFIKEGRDRYWNAFTRGWGREQHARVFLLQCIDEVDAGRAMAQLFAAMARKKLTKPEHPTPFDAVFEVFGAPAFRGGLEAAAQKKEYSRADAIRAMYSAAYPIEASRLTDEQLERAIVEWSRVGGPRKGLTAPHKWDFLASVCESIGLGTVTGSTLENSWKAWKKKLRDVAIHPASAPAPVS